MIAALRIQYVCTVSTPWYRPALHPPSLRKCFRFRLKRSITASAMSRLMLCNLGNTSTAGNDTNNNANTNSSMEDDDSYPLPTIYRYVKIVCPANGSEDLAHCRMSHSVVSCREAERICDKQKNLNDKWCHSDVGYLWNIVRVLIKVALPKESLR